MALDSVEKEIIIDYLIKVEVCALSQLGEGSGCFSRHARVGGHPGSRLQFFWIPAFAGMTDLSPENTPSPKLIILSYTFLALLFWISMN
jgi:hypothetical protein